MEYALPSAMSRMGSDVEMSVSLNPSNDMPPITHTMETPTLKSAMNVAAKENPVVMKMMAATIAMTNGVSLVMSLRA